MAQPPVAVICVGMAGSGKTTFMQRLNLHLHSIHEPPYVINLDPAVKTVPFESNIDIRDSINYRQVMSQYNLGPNGGILTSLNLFATKVDQILAILERRCRPSKASEHASQQSDTSTSVDSSVQTGQDIKHILVDTPGQIEVFVWSASGQILLSSIASSFPTVLAYVIDTPRTASTSTFMSNMLYACSILYKTKLPMILVFNKTDVQSADFAKEWLTDFEAFQSALRKEEETGRYGGLEGSASVGGSTPGSSGYMGSLLNSMSLVLEEFYKHLGVVGVSSFTGAGIEDFFEALNSKAKEYEEGYASELRRRQNEHKSSQEQERQTDLGNMMKDLKLDSSSGTFERKTAGEPETISDFEDDDDLGMDSDDG